MKHLRGAAGIILSLIFAVCFMCSPAFAASRLYQGMDVSSWQGDIDFQAVRAAGIQVVYIRAGVGLEYVDPYFQSNYEKALDAGLNIGYYHYVTAADTFQARQQAEFFYSLIRDKQIDCCPAMDFESFPGLSTQEINAIGLSFMETLGSLLGYDPALYTCSCTTCIVYVNLFKDRSFHDCCSFQKADAKVRTAIVKRAIFEQIYINNTSSTRACI